MLAISSGWASRPIGMAWRLASRCPAGAAAVSGGTAPPAGAAIVSFAGQTKPGMVMNGPHGTCRHAPFVAEHWHA